MEGEHSQVYASCTHLNKGDAPVEAVASHGCMGGGDGLYDDPSTQSPTARGRLLLLSLNGVSLTNRLEITQVKNLGLP